MATRADSRKGVNDEYSSLDDRITPPISFLFKLGSCTALLFFSVGSTLFAEASKSENGTYPYNSFMIPCTVEAVKLCVSTALLVLSRASGDIGAIQLQPAKFAMFALPALCYFVSNNCMFYIIKDLGPTTFQITNNLKVLSTGVLMRVFLGRKLTWLQWKALVLLVLGSAVTQLRSGTPSKEKRSGFGYTMVIMNSLASGAGGVISEKLLKGGNGTAPESIHLQNVQLYFFGLSFGLASSWPNMSTNGVFDGFNFWAYATVMSLSLAGLLVSLILKYLDNFAKCFVAALAIFFVAAAQVASESNILQPNLVIGIVLTCMALEQYHIPQ